MIELEHLEPEIATPKKASKIDDSSISGRQSNIKDETTETMPSYRTTTENTTKKHDGTGEPLELLVAEKHDGTGETLELSVVEKSQTSTPKPKLVIHSVSITNCIRSRGMAKQKHLWKLLT